MCAHYRSATLTNKGIAMANASLSSDFSPIAAQYDATRDMPHALLETFYQRLIYQRIIPLGGTLLDAGCGTGQMSLALSHLDFTIRGYDISPTMIDIARSKLGPASRASYDVADVRSLPEHDAAFDTVLVSKLFMHIQDWRQACRELLRVLKPGGCLIEIFEPASYDNAVRRHFSELADAMGYTDRFAGLDPRDRANFVSFLTEEGCEKISVDVSGLRWQKRVRHGDILKHFADRILAEFWYLPDHIYNDILAKTIQWVEDEPSGRETLEDMAPYLAAQVFRKKTAREA